MIVRFCRDTGRRLRLRHAVRQAARGRKPPVIVYQMGKVASSTIEATLNEVPNLAVFRTHGLARWVNVSHPPRALRDLESWLVYHRIVAKDIPARVVTLVRDPISRNISAHFQNLDAIWGVENAHIRISMEDLQKGFLERQPHRRALDWFDAEFKAVLGLDVYAHPFDPGESFQFIGHQTLDVLILRTTLDDAVKARELARLLGTNSVPFLQKNVGAEKSYSAVYNEFARSIVFPGSYLNEMLSHRFTEHFVSPAEIETMREKWTAGRSAEKPGHCHSCSLYPRGLDCLHANMTTRSGTASLGQFYGIFRALLGQKQGAFLA